MSWRLDRLFYFMPLITNHDEQQNFSSSRLDKRGIVIIHEPFKIRILSIDEHIDAIEKLTNSLKQIRRFGLTDSIINSLNEEM